jgi:hypothetical protein
MLAQQILAVVIAGVAPATPRREYQRSLVLERFGQVVVAGLRETENRFCPLCVDVEKDYRSEDEMQFWPDIRMAARHFPKMKIVPFYVNRKT